MQYVTGFAEVNGAKLYYEVGGEGDALLWVHAGIADSRMWDEQFSAFAEHYKVIRYDMRGYGRSPMPPGSFAPHSDANSLLDFLGVERAHLVGLSFGSQTALDLALAYPQKVSALVLGAPSVSGNPPSEEIRRFNAEEELLLERGDLAAATELNLRMWVDGPQRTHAQVDPAVRERISEMQYHAFTVPSPDDVEMQRLAPPALARLAEVRVPVLIVAGDQDVPGVLALADRLEREIPTATKVIMPGVAHMLNLERPAEFNQLVLDFLPKRMD